MAGAITNNNIIITNDIQKISEVLFPRVRLCYGEEGGYNYSRLEQLGYEHLYAFIIGNKSHDRNGWISQNKTREDLFEAIYTEPHLEAFIDNGDTYLKQNGTRGSLRWDVTPMTYPGGRCLTLNFSKTNFKDKATLVFNHFNKVNFTRNIELSITGSSSSMSLFREISLKII